MHSCELLLIATLASFGWVWVPWASPHTDHRTADRAAPTVQIHGNLNGTAHGDMVKSLSADGYRILSLSAYGEPPEVNYASVWQQIGGAPFETIHDADEATYNAWFESWASKGYTSTHIAATGPAGGAVFAGVMEGLIGTHWFQKCDLKSPSEYDKHTEGIDMIVKGFSMYGTPSDRRYCILGHGNIARQQSTIFYTTPIFPIDFSSVYQAEIAKRFWRPSHLFVSEDYTITPQFVDTEVGKWVAMDSLSANDLAVEVITQHKQGLVPIDLHGGGSGDAVRFAIIFAEHPTPEPRKWAATGSVNGFQDNEATSAALDEVMRTWMQKTGVRQAQVGVARNGSTIAERSYTWAESNRAVVEPEDVFLLGSVSKMFVYAAITTLLEAGKLETSTLVYPMLGYHPVDARANNITVEHLLNHAAGYDWDKTRDVAFSFRDVALSLFNGTRPATLRNIIEYQVAQPLDFAPGTDEVYSNYGTMLLSYLVTNVTGMPYLQYLKEHVLDGLDVRLYETAAEKHANDRIVQESVWTGMDPTAPWNNWRQVPGPHGGDGAIKEECMGAFSLSASASTIARFIGRHAVDGTGGRAESRTRSGGVPGAATWASSQLADMDWALNLNTKERWHWDEWEDLIHAKLPQVFNDHPLLA